jgi:hypothetical protein
VCYFGYLGVEIVAAKVRPGSADALWPGVTAIASRHHRGGLRAPAGGKTRTLTLPAPSVVGELACAGCACDDRDRLTSELAPLAHELFDHDEVRSVTFGYLWASAEKTAELACTLDALPITAPESGSFVVRVTRSPDGAWATRSLTQSADRRRGRSRGRTR